jgi:hypothetical protein
MGWRVLLLLFLLLGSAVGPGLFLVRRLAWNPREKLCAAVALSFLVLYLASFAVFALDLPASAHAVISAVCVVLSASAIPDLRRLLRDAVVRRQLAAFGLLFLWTFALLSLVRHYSGDGWAGDWLEHYERTLFFLGVPPTHDLFIELYRLPARPPMMNLVTAHFLAQVGKDYGLFQIVSSFLNLLIVFPCFLVAGILARRASRRVALTACLLATCPMLIQNVTYPWTKLFAGFYAILGIYLHLRGWRKADPARVTLAFVSLATGCLVHYSVGPYVTFLAAHYLIVVFPRRRRRWRELAGLSVASGAVLATWFGWSLATYGPAATFASNTSVAQSSKLSADANIRKIGTNLVNTIVPEPFRSEARRVMETLFHQDDPRGFVRDYTFVLYQENLVVAMGCVGGILVLYLLFRSARSASPAVRRDRAFWYPLAATVLVLGIATVGSKLDLGLAHVCLQPIVLIGVVFAATALPSLPRRVQAIALAGALVDFLVGILLHFDLQHRVFEMAPDATGRMVVRNTAGLSMAAAFNWKEKAVRGLVFWGDRCGDVAAAGVEILLVLTVLVLLSGLFARGMTKSV